MERMLIGIVLACVVGTGTAGAETTEWIGPGGTDYNDSGDWEDDTAWSMGAPLSGDTVILQATNFEGTGDAIPDDERVVTVNAVANIARLETPLTISGTSSGYYETPTSFHWRANKVRLLADMTIGTLAEEDQRLWIDMGPSADLVINGGSTYPKIGSDDDTATVLFDGPSQVYYAGSYWPGRDFVDFSGTLTIGSVANPCLLGGCYWITISEDPLDLIPDLPGGLFVCTGDASTVIITDGSSMCGWFANDWGPQLDEGGKIVLEGEGFDIDADADPDGALVAFIEGWQTPDVQTFGQTGTTTIEMTGDTEIGVKVSPNLVLKIAGNVVGPAGAPGCTLTKSGVGILQFDGDVGIDCANTVEMHVKGGKVLLNPTCTYYGDIYVHAGGTLIASPSQVHCGTIDTATYGGTLSQMGIWTGAGAGVSWHDPLNWLDGVVPSATASIPGAVANPTIEIDTPAFPGPALTTLDSLITTGACTLQVDADMKLLHCDTRTATVDIVTGSTLTLDNSSGTSFVRELEGGGTFFKTGLYRCDTATGAGWFGYNSPLMTGEIIVDEGLFGQHTWANGSGAFDSSGFFPNATITIQNDGMMAGVWRDHTSGEIWGELRLDGNGMGGLAIDVADGGATPGNGNDWLCKRGSFKRYIEYGNSGVGPYANPVTLLSSSGFICGHTWGWSPGSGEDTELSGLVSGTGTLIKMGESALILSGTVTNSGSDCVEVREGCLIVDGSITGGDVVVDAPTPWANAGHHWRWPESWYNTTYMQFQPNLGGTGTIAHKLKVLDGGWLFPQKSMPDPTQTLFPSDLTVGDAQIGGATWEVGIKAIGNREPVLCGDTLGGEARAATTAEGTGGTDWDLLTVTATGTNGSGVLEITATPQNPVTIKVVSLDANDDPGPLEGLEIGSIYSWPIARADAIIGFDESAFVVDSSGFTGAADEDFYVALANGDTELRLEYTYSDCWWGKEWPWDDCKVNILDLIAVRNHLNEPVDSGNEMYDVTGDGKINILDMILVRNWLNTACP